MKRKITDALLKSLKPAPLGKRVEVWDTLIPGFGIRVTDRDVRSYVLYIRWPGGSYSRGAIGTTDKMSLVTARGIARQWLELVAQGIDPRHKAEAKRNTEAAEQRAVTFSAVAENYIREHLAGMRRGRDDAQEIRRHLISHWRDTPIQDIRRADVKQVIKGIADTPATARLVLSHVSRIWSWAIETELYGVEINPARDIKARKLLGVKPWRERVLEDDELRALCRACDLLAYPFGPLFKLIILTGTRVSEAAQARWGEFVLNGDPVWIIPGERYKSGQSHRIPLSHDVIELLNSLPRHGSDYLFSCRKNKPVAGLSKGKAKLDRLMTDYLGKDVDPFVLHDLRRTVRTRLSKLKVPENVAELVIGHSKKGLQRVYDQHSYADEQRAALEDWARHLRAIVSPEASPGATVHRLQSRRAS
jgi:integrase